jgi:hypothetical protein
VFSVKVIPRPFAPVYSALTRYELARRRRIGGTTQLPPHGGMGNSTHERVLSRESAQMSWCLYA